MPVGDLEQVLQLYQEKYFDLNVQHFHEKLRDQHDLKYSYTWVKTALTGQCLPIRTSLPRDAEGWPPHDSALR
jgi:hypothetical protein